VLLLLAGSAPAMAATPTIASAAARFDDPRLLLPLELVVPAATPDVDLSAAGTASSSTAASSYPRPWGSVEDYYLRLLNCTRTGGWVWSNGHCSGYGTGHYSPYVPPLRMDYTLAGKTARPWAKYLAQHNACTHGDFGARMRNAGYHDWAGENLGCRSGDPYAAVLASHRYFQSEKAANGGHWRNIKDTRWKIVGVGVWVYSGRVRLATDFYQP
jgi:uncharacterized protein YkwD